MDREREHVVRHRGEEQDANEEAAALVVEEEADEEEVGVAQRPLLMDDAVDGQHHGEEAPEEEASEDQWSFLVVREDAGPVDGEQAHGLADRFTCSPYFSIIALNSRSPRSEYPSRVMWIRSLLARSAFSHSRTLP